MTHNDHEHWPIKCVDRESAEFIIWACEGCNKTFKTKKEFNQHIKGGGS